jgi:hypothetical protein
LSQLKLSGEGANVWTIVNVLSCYMYMYVYMFVYMNGKQLTAFILPVAVHFVCNTNK